MSYYVLNLIECLLKKMSLNECQMFSGREFHSLGQRYEATLLTIVVSNKKACASPADKM